MVTGSNVILDVMIGIICQDPCQLHVCEEQIQLSFNKFITRYVSVCLCVCLVFFVCVLCVCCVCVCVCVCVCGRVCVGVCWCNGCVYV